MPDYISTSRKIWEWLKSLGITFKVDEFAPKVFERRKKQTITGIVEGPGRLYACSEPRIPTHDYVCPFFGPGGEGNLLKALRAWAKKNKYTLASAQSENGDIEWRLHCCENHRHAFAHSPIGRYGKEDGVVLHDLLYKLMEETK